MEILHQVLIGTSIIALVFFSATLAYCCIWLYNERTAAKYYNSIRENIAEAIEQIDSQWGNEPMQPITVQEILVQLHNRRVIYWDELREREGGLADRW